MKSATKILLTVVSLLAGEITIGVVESVGHVLHPMPVGLNILDDEAVQQYQAALPLTAFLMVLLAWFLGSGVGAYLAARLTGASGFGVVASVVLLLAGVMNLSSHEHPGWFWIAGPLMFILGGAIGIRLARAIGDGTSTVPDSST